MSAIVTQKDLIAAYKKETILNVAILYKLRPVPVELSLLICKQNYLEKPTQNLFNKLTHYFLSIIDTQVYSSLTWPLYDTKAERSYRNELSNFINKYSSQGLLSPIMSSYLVNPSSYKVTVLLYQLSLLCVKQLVRTKVVQESQAKLFEDVSEKYKTEENDSFVRIISMETEKMFIKCSNYLHKRKTIEKIAACLKNKIMEMETKISELKCQNYINQLVDDYVSKECLDDEAKTEILQIKNVYNKSPPFFNNWLLSFDRQFDLMQCTWNNKVVPFLKLSTLTFERSNILIKRYTGEIDKSSYSIGYDPQNDCICINQLENQVNSQQKFILKNLEINENLNFPNLVRAYVISISFILKNNRITDKVVKFNECLDTKKKSFKEIVLGLGLLKDRILNAESQLKPEVNLCSQLPSYKIYPMIPPIPDFSDLKLDKDKNNLISETYTPLNINKKHTNFLSKSNEYVKPHQRNLVPFYQTPKDDFIKSLISSRAISYECTNTIKGIHHMSTVAHTGNETIAGCSAGFTKQQISRLLSTKKTGSSKKSQSKRERPSFIKQKDGLFDESILSNENSGLFRSYSSPNLYENRVRRYINIDKPRKLSIMQEDSKHEMSGIKSLDNSSNLNQTHGFGIAESSRKELELFSLPVISVTNEAEQRINDVLYNKEYELESEITNFSTILRVANKNQEKNINQDNKETLKREASNNLPVLQNVCNLQNLKERFRKVRASTVPEKKEIKRTDREKRERENFNNATNRVLPDLLSPSCTTYNTIINEDINYLDQLYLNIEEGECRRPRESLGTALGVDQTFLDQFDLID